LKELHNWRLISDSVSTVRFAPDGSGAVDEEGREPWGLPIARGGGQLAVGRLSLHRFVSGIRS